MVICTGGVYLGVCVQVGVQGGGVICPLWTDRRM